MAAHASLIAHPEAEDLIENSPGDDLIQRLDDPKIASSLAVILDHADLLATIITGIDGMLRRSDVIGDSLASAVADVRDLATSSNGQRLWPTIDLAALSDTLTRLSAGVVDATPAIDRLLHSPLTDSQTADVLVEVGEALLEGKRAAAEDSRGPKGIFALMRVTKDPDVSRGLGFMIHIAKAFGRNLAPQEPQKDSRTPRHAVA